MNRRVQTESAYSDQVREAVSSGRKVEAIKLVREERNMSLRDAKREVEQLERSIRGTRIDQQPVVEEEGGAKMLIRIAVIVALILVAYFVLLPLVTG